MDFADAECLVTGATGFLGTALVRTLLNRGLAPERLRCVVRDPTAAVARGIPPASVRTGDLGDPAALRRAAAGTTHVFHLAGAVKAARPRQFDLANAEGTRHLAAAVRSAAPGAFLVLVSSLAAAGPSIDGSGTDAPPDRCRPVSRYGESKRQGELMARRSGLRLCTVRPPVVYGPGDAATRLLFRQATSRICAVPPRPSPLSIAHVGDVVSLLLAAAAAAPDGAVLPIDGPQRTDTHALLRAIAAACGRDPRLLPVPLAVAAAAAQACDLFARMTGRAGFFSADKVKELRAPGWVADGRPAMTLLGWSPRIGLADGLAEVAAQEGFARTTRGDPARRGDAPAD